MSNKTPPKSRNARSDSLSPSTGESPGSPYSAKETRAKPSATPTHPPSNTAFPSSLPSTGTSPTKKDSAPRLLGGGRVPYGPSNMVQIEESTTAPPKAMLALEPPAAAVPDRPTSGSYHSKPLEPGYATAGLDLTEDIKKEEGTTTATTRDFKTQTEEGVGGDAVVKGEEEEKRLDAAEEVEEKEALKRAHEALRVEKEGGMVVEAVEKAE